MAGENQAAVFNDAEVKKLLNRIGKNVAAIEKKDKRIVAAISGPIFRDVMDHFAKQEGPDNPWQAKDGGKWSKSYTAWMRNIGRAGNKQLQFSGNLRKSLLPQAMKNSWRRTSDGILWFNQAKTASGFPYAYAHNEGGPVLPQRKFMWISDTAVKTVADIVSKWTVK